VADELFNVLSILQQFHIQKKDLYYLDVPLPRFTFREAVKEEQSLVREVNGAYHPMTNARRSMDGENPYVLLPVLSPQGIAP